MNTYTCCVCGKDFQAARRSICCPDCKQGRCVICGKQFTRISPYTQQTCSPKCRGIYRVRTGVSKRVAEKSMQTKIDRYGTLDPQQCSAKIPPKKICPLCGKEFQPDTFRQQYCKDIHYVPCPVCGKLTELKDISIGPQACSEECRMKRIYQTNIERYGNKDSVNSEHAKALAKKHNLVKYGVEHPMQCSVVRERATSTMQERFGVDYAMQNPIIREKAKQTNLSRYGVEYPMQFLSIKEKAMRTAIEHYGGVGLASPQLRAQIIATNRAKYGTDFPAQSPEIQEKAKQTSLRKYGYEYFQQSLDAKLKSIKDPSKAEEWVAFIADPETYISTHYDNKPPIYILCKDLGVTDTRIYDLLLSRNCSHLINHTKQSAMEYEIVNLLKRYMPENEIVLYSRKIISPLEVDIWLPKYNIGFECNPTITHNSSISDPWGGEPKAPSYHKYKTDKAIEAGAFIFHIFGYEWNSKQNIIESMICNLIGQSGRRVYARKTCAKAIPSNEARAFLEDNHRQGATFAKYYYGLYTDEEELVSVMSFNRMRPSIGKTESDTQNTYELSRFCNLIGTSVVGGASKLLTAFIRDHQPDKIVSFSDRAHTRGGLYSKLGFHQVNASSPSYVWVRLSDDQYYHRVNCQKSNLRNLFKDNTIDIENKTERDIMIEHGYVQVYDSGTVRWELYLK